MRVALLSSNADDRSFFEAAARLVNLDFFKVPNIGNLFDEVTKNPETIIIVDVSSELHYREFEKQYSDRVGLFSAAVSSNQIFYVGSQPVQKLSYLINSEIFSNYVQRPFLKSYIGQMSRLLKMASERNPFGIEQYLNPNVKVQTVQVTKSSQKLSIVESLKEQLTKINFRDRIATIISTAADELIMNAIFDAPVDALGKQKYAQTPRSSLLDLVGKDVVEFKVAFDGEFLGISVIDQYGSLNKKKLLTQHLGKSYQKSDYETKTISAGAGLGLAHVYHNCGGVVFGCAVGEKTEVMLFFKKASSFKEFKTQFHFLSTFTYFQNG